MVRFHSIVKNQGHHGVDDREILLLWKGSIKFRSLEYDYRKVGSGFAKCIDHAWFETGLDWFKWRFIQMLDKWRLWVEHCVDRLQTLICLVDIKIVRVEMPQYGLLAKPINYHVKCTYQPEIFPLKWFSTLHH